MKKEIKLMTRYGSLVDREPFLLEVGDELELEFVSPYRLDSAVVTLSHAGRKQSFRFSGNTFRVSDEFPLSEGELGLELALVKNGRKEMRWDIEPILLREYEGRVEVIPELEEFKRQNAETLSRLEEYRKAVEALRADREEEKKLYCEAMERIELLEKHYDPLSM